MPLRWSVLLCLFALGCPRGPKRPPILISRITLSESTLLDNSALGVTTEDLKRRLVDAMDATGRYRPLPPADDAKRGAADTFRARVEITFTRESDETADGGLGSRRAEVGLTLTLIPGRADGEVDSLRTEASAHRLFVLSDGGAADRGRTRAFQAALDAALRRACRDLLLAVDAARKSDADLIADLGAADAGVRECAVRQLAERKNPAAVPALIERLKDPDRDAVLRAMGALEGIHDPRAVRPLIDLTERQDPGFVAQVVYVIGTLGGPDAEAFLFTLQNGSSEPQVRVAATEASAELRRRRAKAAGAADPKGPAGTGNAAGSVAREKQR